MTLSAGTGAALRVGDYSVELFWVLFQRLEKVPRRRLDKTYVPSDQLITLREHIRIPIEGPRQKQIIGSAEIKKF
jgi:hypothetical protein